MHKVFLLFITTLLLIGKANHLSAQEDTVPRISDFVKEIQQSKDYDGQYCIAFWFPWQYWETALLQGLKGQPMPQQYKDMISTMKQYNIIGAIDVKITPMGMVYGDEEIVRDSAVMIVNDSVRLKPLDPKEYPEQIRELINLLSPIMKQLLGQMGQNQTWLVFPNRDSKGNAYADAKIDSRFEVHWRQNFPFKWRLPLDVLTPPKYCPVDGEKLSGKYKFCPYHGKELKNKK